MNRDLVKKIFERTIKGSLLLIVLMFIIIKDYKSFVLGYIFGTLISMTNFLLLKNSVERSVKMDPGSANRYGTSQYLLRMLINAIVLIIGAKADYLNLFTTVLGLLSTKLVIKISNIADKNFLSSN